MITFPMLNTYFSFVQPPQACHFRKSGLVSHLLLCGSEEGLKNGPFRQCILGKVLFSKHFELVKNLVFHQPNFFWKTCFFPSMHRRTRLFYHSKHFLFLSKILVPRKTTYSKIFTRKQKVLDGRKLTYSIYGQILPAFQLLIK